MHKFRKCLERRKYISLGIMGARAHHTALMIGFRRKLATFFAEFFTFNRTMLVFVLSFYRPVNAFDFRQSSTL